MNTLEESPTRKTRIRREHLTVLGVIALLLGSLAVPQVFRRLADNRQVAAVDTGLPLKPSPAMEFRGICIQLQSNDPDIPYEDYIREIAQTGANTVCISLAALQENCAASSIFLEYRRTPPTERLARIIDLAHELNLRVALMPIVLLENPGSGEWRGKIAPREPDRWWEDYENIVLHYARLGERTKAEILIIGSELVSLEDQTDRWRGLIAKVRKAYSGRLTYSANWDHYEDTHIQWWKDLDLVGMTSYYDLVGEKKPSLEVLLESWKPIKKHILEWQKKVARPILFTEVGWASQEGCAKEPWNYYASTNPDPTTQDLCFQAFFRTWKDEKTVAGVLVWEWRNAPWQKGGLEDISFVPVGKPALKTIKEYFSAPGVLDAASRPASAPASAPGEGLGFAPEPEPSDPPDGR